MSKLFRDEAMQQAARRLDGTVVLASPLSTWLLANFLASVVIGSLVFASMATYARKETVIGWITPNRGLIRAVAIGGGRIEHLAVREGDIVDEGAEIATVGSSSDIAEGDSGEILVAGLESEKAAVRTGAEAISARLQAEARHLHDQRANLIAERREVVRQIALQEHRVRLVEIDVERASSLAAQGFFPRAQLEAREAALLATQQDLAALNQRRLSLDRDIISVAARMNAIPIDARASEATLATTLAQLDQRRAELRSRTEYVVRSTVAGRVAAISARLGQTLQPGASIATIVPKGSRLEAELYVPSRAAGFIREGQEVRLMYEAFPHQRFGAGQGEISTVSQAVIGPGEVAIPGVTVNEPVFRVQVRLTQEYVNAYGQRTPLQPGMLLRADVIIDRRSLFEWLLDPIYSVGRR